jgi:hypothetical protein
VKFGVLVEYLIRSTSKFRVSPGSRINLFELFDEAKNRQLFRRHVQARRGFL